MREIRVIGANSEQLGVMTPEDALVKAREAGLDLVEVAATSRPPVCRIMDYGRYKYEQKKKKSSNQSHAATLKEIKMRPGTDMHDLQFKLNNARKFLMEGDKVKVTVMFRGREMVHINRGREKLMQVREMLGTLAKMENPPRMEGRFMSMILVAEREAVAEAKRLEEIEAEEAGEEAGEPVTDKKAERRAAKQRKVDEAQASELEAETAESEGESPEGTA
ncbi:MAG: translation initiation factor IF-3 [Myxococcota bacterium]